MSKTPRLFILLLILAAVVAPASAQIAVDVSVKRRIWLRHEPILATVTVRNLSGKDLFLSSGDVPWFGFQINMAGEPNALQPLNPNYQVGGVEIPLGESVARTVDLTTLFPMSEYGTYKIRAMIYGKEWDKFFPSRAVNIEVTEGTKLWEETVGVPETIRNAGALHTYTLLSHQNEGKTYLYVRVEDRNNGIVYCTTRIGQMLGGQKPSVQFDTTNNLYILSYEGPKTYLLTQMSVNGEFLGQSMYFAPKSQPYMRRTPDGGLQIVGARRQTREVAEGSTAPAAPAPKLSERPPGFPRP